MKQLYHRTPFDTYDACLDEYCTFPYHYELIDDDSVEDDKRWILVDVLDGKFHNTPEMYIKTLQGDLDSVTEKLDNIVFLTKETNRITDKLSERLSWLSASLKDKK